MPMTKLPRRWKHLTMIRSTLANLRGGGSLANELIQNADDADGAQRLKFRFTPDYLEVSDDGGFRACEQPNDPGDCPWEVAGRRPCDFHAFRELGAASKAGDPSLTGAFGIGFLAVYQVTDHPELFSRGIHWILDEENEAVSVCGGCDQVHVTTGTTFRLPWAKRRTRMREELGAEPVSADTRRRLQREFIEQVPHAMIFLRKLREIEIADEAPTVTCFRRSVDGGTVRISAPTGDQEWMILAGDFATEAAMLSRRHPLIGNRHAQVRIALQCQQPIDGRLYATLPTTIPTSMPFHLDASFFPRLDRKGILLESGYEADWNRAAIAAGARLLAAQLERIAPVLGPKPFWSLVDQARALDRRRDGEARALAVFWAQLLSALPSASVMWTRSGTWARVTDVVAAPRDRALADLLEDLGVPTISPSIQSLVPARPLGIKPITLDRLLDELEALGLDEDMTVEALPDPLRALPRRRALLKALGTLVAGHDELDRGIRERLRQLPLWEGTDGRFTSFAQNWLVTRDTVQPFARFSQAPFVIWPERDAASRALAAVGDRYLIDQALNDLKSAAGELATLELGDAGAILAWFQSRLGQLSESDIDQLGSLALVPTEVGLRPAGETVQAGGFHDPLGLTSVLDPRETAGLEDLIRKFGIRKLRFAEYLREYVAAVGPGPLSANGLIELVRQCVKNRDVIDADPALAKLLTDLAWIPCQDGHRRPPGSVYFESTSIREVLSTSAPLVHAGIRPRTAAADLLRRLGASDTPRPADVVTRVRQIVTTAPGEQQTTQVVAILRYLARQAGELDQAFAPLRTLPWLPAEDQSVWFAPSQVFLTRNQALFATTGRFLALRRADQHELQTILLALGVRSSPSLELVVSHVTNLAAVGQEAGNDVLRWLDGHAPHPQLERLVGCAFLPTADGRLERPDRVFRHRHQLIPWRAMLRPGVERFANLLDALKVAPAPDATAAAHVLIEVSDTLGDGQELDRATLAVVNHCWQLLLAASDADLDSLDGRSVVPAADGLLHRTDAVLLEDLPDVGRWLSQAARDRLVALDGRQQAFEWVGVKRLSQRRRGQVVACTDPIEGHWIEGRLRERRMQLARVTAAEGGSWHGVIELTQNIKVTAVGGLTIRFSLDGLIGLPENPAVEQGAFYDRDHGNLYVRMSGGKPDWHELARVVRDEILPGSGPGTSLAIKAALAAQSPDDADADLRDYPPLRDEVLAEFERAAQEHAQGAESTDGVDTDYEPYDEPDEGDDHSESHEEDNPADEQGDLGDTHDSAGFDDQQDDDESARAGGGTGGERRTQPDGVETGGTGNGRVGNQRNASTAGAAKRGKSGRNDGARLDSQLISYVSPNPSAVEPGLAGDRSREQHLRDAAGEAGVDLVIKHLEPELRDYGWRIEKMPEKNKGYDILVRGTDGEPQRYIEVKATAGVWGLRGVGLTEPQFSLARQKRERYWLYVVEDLYQPEAHLWWIRDPAGRVDYFHYDYGWQAVAQGHASTSGAPVGGPLPDGSVIGAIRRSIRSARVPVRRGHAFRGSPATGDTQSAAAVHDGPGVHLTPLARRARACEHDRRVILGEDRGRVVLGCVTAGGASGPCRVQPARNGSVPRHRTPGNFAFRHGSFLILIARFVTISS
jgi:hypothetical protein